MAEPETMKHPELGLPETEVSSVGEKCSPDLKTAELYLNLATECMKKVQSRTLSAEGSTPPKFHYEQCKYLAAKLESAVKSGSSFFEQFQTRWLEIENRLEVYKLLHTLATAVESFILGCCKDAWIQAALTLPDVSPHVSSIGFNLELCRIVLSDGKEWGGKQIYSSNEVARTRKSEFKVVKEKALLDQVTLTTNVKAVLDDEPSEVSHEERELANYLLFSFNTPTTVSQGSSDRWGFLKSLYVQFQGDRKVKNLALEGTMLVKGTWLGNEVAKKTFFGPDFHQFKKEAETHAKLSHPNIISLLCCDVDKSKCSIVMEWMDRDLHNLIQQRLEENSESLFPFTLLEAVGIMNQIAEGVNYLHRNKVIHRDLKSMNILVISAKATEIKNGYVHVRVADFGLSKTKDSSSTFSSQTPNKGTHRWMAPEVIKIPGAIQRLPYDPRKCDVYSFAMVCLEILTGKLPFSHIEKPNEVKSMVLEGKRPDLPDHCQPDKLTTLIQRCWDQDSKKRPQFPEICEELKYVQWLLMTGPPPKIALYLKLAAECMEGVQKMTSPKFNEKQCEYLADKLKLVVKEGCLFLESSRAKCIESSSSEDMAKRLEIFKLLFMLAKEIESFIQCCCSESWFQAAMTLTNVSVSVGFFLELCKIVFSNSNDCEAIHILTPMEIDKISKVEAQIVNHVAIEDEKTLLRTMEAELDSSRSENNDLVEFSLLRRKRFLLSPGYAAPGASEGLSPEIENGYEDVRTMKTNFNIIWSYFGKLSRKVHDLECLRPGASPVHKAKWLGMEVVKKTFYVPDNQFFFKEVEILSRLCHPNITSLLCCAMDRRKCSIVTELMDGDLSTLIHPKAKGNVKHPTFTILEVVSIIHQVAEGVNYLHQNRVVHGNLKLSNILIKSVKTKDMENGYVHVKVTDFGVGNTKQSNQEADVDILQRRPFKDDVFYFAMVCYEFLIGHVPFSTGGTSQSFQSKSDHILSGHHPQLPAQCPNGLKSLIEKCWQQAPRKRPSFAKICEELKFMKYLLLIDPHPTIDIPLQASTDDKSGLTMMQDEEIVPLSSQKMNPFRSGERADYDDYEDSHIVKDFVDRDLASQPKYKVFISYSNVHRNFVEQLCIDLERSGRFPFFDKQASSLSQRKEYPVMVFQAIHQCEVGVVVISKDFFMSKWPMLELLAMVKSKREGRNFKIFPIFLELSPSECRDIENIQRWASLWSEWAEDDNRMHGLNCMVAVNVLISYHGLEYFRRGSVVQFQGKVVEAICRIVSPEGSYMGTYMQGRMRLCEAIHKIIKSTQSSDVHVVGLHGISGIGKTMVCKALCDDIPEFRSRVCHLELECKGRMELLQHALQKLTNINHQLMGGWNEDECLYWLKKSLHKQKVFLAIDNVSDTLETIEQAKVYLGAGFAKGSIVIVVAGSLDQLQMLNIPESDCFEMPSLEMVEARSLFLYHAAPENENEVDEELITRCVQRCSFKKVDGKSHYYHPLALKMLGEQLGYESEKWAEKLDELNTSDQFQEREDPVFFILRKIFNTLSSEEQLLLVDAALFFPERPIWMKRRSIFEWLGMVHGISIEDVKMRLEGLKGKLILEYLDDHDGIGMHDLWRKFCIMETNFGEWRGGCWVNEVQGPLFRHAGSRLSGGDRKLLQRICLRGCGFSSNVEEVNLDSCTNVAVLKLVNWHVEPDQVLDLRDVRCLKSLEIVSNEVPMFRGSSVEVIGLGLLDNLLVLKWDNIRRQSPSIEEIGCLTGLQVLQLESGCNKNKLPKLDKLHSLRQAKLSFGDGAYTIVGLSSKMTNLRFLDLAGCYQLRSCSGVGNLVALEELVLRGCTKLEALPYLGRLFKLLVLDISGCHLISALLGLGDLISLQELRAEGCSGLQDDSLDLRKLTNLQVLDILFVNVEHMSGLGDLIALQQLRIDASGLDDPCALHRLTRVTTAEVNGWGQQVVPSVATLVNLKRLTLLQFTGVNVELAGLLKLTALQALTLRHCRFKDVSGLSNLITLQSLEIQDCGELQRLPHIHKLSRLESLDIMDCPSLTDWDDASITHGDDNLTMPRPLEIFGTFIELETLRFRTSSIHELPDLSYFPRLIELDLVHCENLMFLTNSKPLEELAVLRLYGCRNLGELPDFNGSKRLISFTLYSCGVQLTAQQIEKLKAMCPALVLDKSHLGDIPDSEEINSKEISSEEIDSEEVWLQFTLET